MILNCNQMVYSEIISLAFCQNSNYKNFDKTCMKLFPNFTRRHLIIHTNDCQISVSTDTLTTAQVGPSGAGLPDIPPER